METLSFDKPCQGSTIQRILKSNSIYNYLDKSINLFIVPFYEIKNRKYLVGFLPWFKDLYIVWKLIMKIKKADYDAIYVNVNEELDGLLLKLLKWLKFKNIIIAYHEVVECHTDSPRLKQVVKDTVGLGFPIVTYSQHTRQQLKELTDNKYNIHTIYFGPFETFRLFNTDTPIVKDPYILFIGSILPYKGLDFLYNTVSKELPSLQYRVVVAGRGKDPVLEKMVDDKKFFLINRYLSDEEFANLTRHARCVICPYKAGSQSGVTHVSMVYGTPVIATHAGAFEEYIEEGKNGWIVNYGDTKHLAELIKKVTRTDHDHFFFVPSHLNWGNIAKQVEDLCTEIRK